MKTPPTNTAVASALLVITLFGSASAFAQGGGARFMRECAQWVEKKGYSVDYIEQRTGQRPAGNTASQWRSNLDPKDAGVGDVVFLRTDTSDGYGGQRAEVVDEVLRDPAGTVTGFRTSSMNAGKMLEPHCNITDNFGKVVQRRVPFDRVVRAWRPDGPR